MAKKKAAKAKSRRAAKKVAPKKKAMDPIDREQVCLTLSGINGSLFLPERYAYDSVFERLVEEELAYARAKHQPFPTLHHGHSVLLEEMDEFWDEVKAQKPDPAKTLHELVQVASSARRLAEDLLGIGYE